ncbi:hypothetical protein BC829DRAFT_216952 [Chytridium lagenaria]|nr:hypothetical protein BC829DRAFT_216952 [Chytridium lagenaria]
MCLLNVATMVTLHTCLQIPLIGFRFEDPLCLTEETVLFERCTVKNTQTGWKYQYLPPTTIPAKERLFRIKAGNGNCLQQISSTRYAMQACAEMDEQIFRRETGGYQNMKTMACIEKTKPDDFGSQTIRPGKCYSTFTMVIISLKDMIEIDSKCLTYNLDTGACNDSTKWEIEFFIPSTPTTPGPPRFTIPVSTTTATTTTTATATATHWVEPNASTASWRVMDVAWIALEVI